MIVHVAPHWIEERHGFPACHPRWTAVHAPQLRLDFLSDNGAPIGHAIVLDLSRMAFILHIQVLPVLRGRGHGRSIHLELIRRYGAVACETHCSEAEAMCIRSLRLRGEIVLTKEPGPTTIGRPAIYRSGGAVERMFVCRAAITKEPTDA